MILRTLWNYSMRNRLLQYKPFFWVYDITSIVTTKVNSSLLGRALKAIDLATCSGPY